MLPDMDSDSGHAQREIMTFAAATTPLLLISRFAQMRLDHEQTVIAAGCVYIIVRFGLGEILRRYTVHRGMFHSIPAAVIAGLITSMLCSCESLAHGTFKVAAVVLGYMIHLMLDELWAIEWYRARLRFKNSFGTALKLFSPRLVPNLVTYGLLAFVATLAYNDAALMEYFGVPPQQQHFAQGGGPEFELPDLFRRWTNH